ncbi:hypothetical protein ESO86_18180, partial [Agromyces binzhouensis]
PRPRARARRRGGPARRRRHARGTARRARRRARALRRDLGSRPNGRPGIAEGDRACRQHGARRGSVADRCGCRRRGT